MEYNFKEIEAKWQRRWQEEETYRVEADPTRPKFYVLDMFPYPSGAVCTSDTRWAISLRTSTRATNGFAASTYFIRWATTLSACLPNSTPFRRGSTPP